MKETIVKHVSALALSSCAATGPVKEATNAPVTPNYQTEYTQALKTIDLYREYKDCVEVYTGRQLPIIKILSGRSTDLDIIDAYSDYVNDLIKYIHDIRTDCRPPMDLTLPSLPR